MDTNKNILETIAGKIQAQNIDAAVLGNSISVKLPKSCSVSLETAGENLEVVAKFGKVRRATAIILNLLTSVVLVSFFVFSSDSLVITAIITVLVLCSILYDVNRWFITQRVINFIQRELSIASAI
jgi:hypothetical protein